MEIFSWQTPEYAHRHRSADWYWTVGIIAGALAITSIIFGNILFAAVIVIGAFTLSMFAARHPSTISVHVDAKGVRIDKTLYPYSTLEAFGIDSEHHDGPRLHLRSKKPVMPVLTVPVATEDLDGLRILLVKHLKEEAFEETFMQKLFEKLGF